MTEKLTRICLPGLNGPGAGLMDWGEHSYEDMRKQLRARAASMKEEAEAVLAAPDGRHPLSTTGRATSSDGEGK